MRRIVLTLILTVLMLGCGNRNINEGNVSGTDIGDLQLIDDILYEYGNEKPYTGKVITRNEEGKILVIETSKDGKIEGEVRTYYVTGKLKEEYSIKNGKIEGPYIWYSKDDTVRIDATYRNNEKENESAVSVKDKKPFTGTYTETYDNGNISQTIKFVDGRREGETIFYYENGKIRERIPYSR